MSKKVLAFYSWRRSCRLSRLGSLLLVSALDLFEVKTVPLLKVLNDAQLAPILFIKLLSELILYIYITQSL